MAWVRVTRRYPCAICAQDSWCVRSADGQMAHCMRLESSNPAKCRMGGWIHRLIDPLPPIKIMPRLKKPKADWLAKAQELFKDPMAAANRSFIAKNLGLQLPIVERMLVGYGYDEYRHEYFSSWPELHGCDGGVCGIIRRYPDGSKKMMEGGSHGIYCLTSHFENTPGAIFIVEGGTDTAALSGINMNVIGRPSNIGGVEDVAKHIAFTKTKKRLIVVCERDEKPDKRGQVAQCPATCKCCMRCWPGLEGGKVFAGRLSEALGRPVEAALIKEAKDAREWVRKRPLASLARLMRHLEFVA